MSEWINHVKKYQSEHGCSYKDALKCAKSTYNKGSIEGGKFNLKKAVNKGAKGVKQSVAKGRKITKEISRNIDKYGPLASMVAPELAPIVAVNEGVRRINGSGFGSTKKGKVNPYLNGGSFAVPEASHGGSFAVPYTHGGCMTCRGGGMINSTLLSPYHPSFAPVNTVKTYTELNTKS